MKKGVLALEDIIRLVRPIARKYRVSELYLFGSYARGEAREDSDLDFLVCGGADFKPTSIFALAEELRAALDRDADVFEIREIDADSEFYASIMKERLLVA